MGLAIDLEGAGGWLAQAGDDFEQRGFSRAGGTEDADHATGDFGVELEEEIALEQLEIFQEQLHVAPLFREK